MNVDSMAQSEYNLYNLYNSQNYAQYTADPPTVSGSTNDGLSNVSNAVNELGNINTNPYTTNLDQYVRDSYQMRSAEQDLDDLMQDHQPNHLST